MSISRKDSVRAELTTAYITLRKSLSSRIPCAFSPAANYLLLLLPLDRNIIQFACASAASPSITSVASRPSIMRAQPVTQSTQNRLFHHLFLFARSFHFALISLLARC